MPDQIDCAVVECVLETADDPTGRQASAPLRFDPTAPPPPPPTVAVEPAGAPRSDNERLTISGRHFVPEDTVWLSQCPEPTDEGSCGPLEPVRVTVGDGGGFTTSFVVRARLPFGGRDVDCRRERCVLLIGTRSGPPLRVPLRFRSD